MRRWGLTLRRRATYGRRAWEGGMVGGRKGDAGVGGIYMVPVRDLRASLSLCQVSPHWGMDSLTRIMARFWVC
jgi:hypothetical protein